MRKRKHLSEKVLLERRIARKRRRLFTFFSLTAILLAVFLSIVLKQPFLTRTTDCANSISCLGNLSGNFDPLSTGEFNGRKVASAPVFDAKIADVHLNVLGDTAQNNKHIYVNLTSQHLEAKEGNTTVLSFPISSGKWHPTPTGDFLIWIKLKYTRMVGGSKALGTYYNLPNVPYVMYFYNIKYPKAVGYGLHGTYWHSNFGHPMSHGCVNISIDNARLLYEWASPATNGKNVIYASSNDPGTPITIFGTPPANEVSYID